MRLAAGVRSHALHEIEDAFGQAAFLLQNCLDDLACFALGETALAQEAFAVFVATGDDLLTCGLDAGDKRRGLEFAKLVKAGAAS